MKTYEMTVGEGLNGKGYYAGNPASPEDERFGSLADKAPSITLPYINILGLTTNGLFLTVNSTQNISEGSVFDITIKGQSFNFRVMTPPIQSFSSVYRAAISDSNYTDTFNALNVGDKLTFQIGNVQKVK